MDHKKIFLLALVIALAALGFSLAIALAAADPIHVQINLEGCRNPSVDLETTNFVCADGDYTSGNLGKTWNELDLVPHRVTTSLGTQADATTQYTIAIVADHIEAGRFGYDFISEPVVNDAKSDASCSVTVGALQTVTPGIGGTDTSMYRLVTISQDKGTTCVFDYYERLALGAAQYPGSSLHSNLTNQNLGTQGVGAQDVSIPVKEILPQELDKDMTATRDADHVWNITKSPTPASVSFANTCDPQAPTSQGVQIKIDWVRLPATPSGDVTIITNVYATNPSHRTITVNVTDQIYEGTTQTTPVGAVASSGPVDVPDNTTQLVLTHSITVSSSASHFNDVATATYTDKVTGIPVPGQTEAKAEADVQTGNTTNTTATINDLESITGANFSFSADSFSGASGAFDGGYVAGTPTTGPVSWTSNTQSDSGSVTFDKTIYVSAPAISSGTLDDTATLTGSDGFTASNNATVNISADAQVALTINKTIPNVLSGSETETFTFQVKNGSNQVVATPSITFQAGETSKSTTVSGLPPGIYTVSEDPATGWGAQSDQKVDISLPSCSGSVTFNNTFSPASARVQKVTIPAGEEAGWEFTLNGPGGLEKVTTSGAGFVSFSTVLQEGSYTITETPKDGWDQTSSSGDCSFSVDYPADTGKVFSCTYENTKRGTATVIKTFQGQSITGSESFTFQLRHGASTASDGTVLDTKVADSTNGGTLAFEVSGSTKLTPGDYQLCEFILPGWDSTIRTMAGAFVPNSSANPAGTDNTYVCIPFTLDAGEDEVFTIDNTPPPGGMAKTIGFWKNWSSCSGGNQAPILDQTLASFPGGGVLIGDLFVDTCPEAVRLLNKSQVNNGKKMANDAAYGLAAQLLAARLNIQAGAGSCTAATDAITAGQALLDAINFTGNGDYLGPKVGGTAAQQRAQALALAATLDQYNNNLLCP